MNTGQVRGTLLQAVTRNKRRLTLAGFGKHDGRLGGDHLPSALLIFTRALLTFTSSSLFMTFLIRARGKLYTLKSGSPLSISSICRVQNASKNVCKS